MRLKSTVLYIIYATIAFIFFLILLFPKERVAEIIAADMNEGLSDCTIEIKRAELIFPPALKAYDFSIVFDERSRIDLEHVIISPRLLSIFSSMTEFSISGKGHGGTVEGELDFGIKKYEPLSSVSSGGDANRGDVSRNENRRPGKENGSSPVTEMYDSTIFLKLAGIGVENFVIPVEGVDILLSGNLNGALHYSFFRDVSPDLKKKNVVNGAQPGNGSSSGELRVSIGNCTVKPGNFLLQRLGNVGFDKVDIAVDKRGNSVDIAEFEAGGSDMKISLGGNLVFRVPSEMSKVDLKGNIMPLAYKIPYLPGVTSFINSSSGKGGSISFRVSGTFGSPRFSTQ